MTVVTGWWMRLCKYVLEYVCFIRFLFIIHWEYVHINYKKNLLYFMLLYLKYFVNFDLNVNCNKNMYQAMGFKLLFI